MVDLRIIIVTYKTDPAVLRNCLMSLAAAHDVSYELFVIDNAYDKRVPAIVHDILPEASVIVNDVNRGFAAAVNVGLKLSTARYALLLNPDAIVPPGTMKKMIEHLDQDKEVGIGSCVIRYPDGSHQESIRRFPKILDQLEILFKLPYVFKHLKAVDRYMMRDTDPLQTQDVDSIMGAFMFIRHELLEKIGPLDERFFIWFEEVDYCKMAHDAGWKVRHYGDVTVTHLKGQSFDTVSFGKKQWWFLRSMCQYFLKRLFG